MENLTKQTTPQQSEEQLELLLELIKKPWQLIKRGKEVGLPGIKNALLVILVFFALNTTLIAFGIYRLISVGFGASNSGLLFLAVFLGTIFFLFIIYKMLMFIKLDIMRVVYMHLTPYLNKLCMQVVDKAENAYQNKIAYNEKKIGEYFSNSILSKKTPALVSNRISKIIDKTPVIGFVGELKQEIASGNKEKASILLFNKMDNFILSNFFGNGKLVWTFWVASINAGLVIAIILQMKKN